MIIIEHLLPVEFPMYVGINRHVNVVLRGVL